MINSPKQGSVRCVVFQEKEDAETYYGVALEFNLVVEGDDPDIVMFNLREAMRGYVASQKKLRGSTFEPLNQKPDKEYEEMWKNINSPQPIPSPFDVSFYGVVPA